MTKVMSEDGGERPIYRPLTNSGREKLVSQEHPDSEGEREKKPHV